MSEPYKKILLLMMGGSGTRFGAPVPKQFVEVAGKPTFGYLVEKYAEIHFADLMVIVCNGDWVEFTRRWIDESGLDVNCLVVPGGSCRSESVKNGLAQAAQVAESGDLVFIHDVTHPYVDVAHLDELAEAALEHGGATMGACQYDTVYGIDPQTNMLQEVIPRQTVVSGASPEVFRFEKLWGIYDTLPVEELENYTSAGALALAFDIPIEIVPTDLINLKITYRQDMEAFKQLFHDYYF